MREMPPDMIAVTVRRASVEVALAKSTALPVRSCSAVVNLPPMRTPAVTHVAEYHYLSSNAALAQAVDDLLPPRHVACRRENT